MKKHIYLPVEYDGSTVRDNPYDILLKEHVFFNRIRSEKIFSYLDFLGIEIPSHIPVGGKVFLFHDLTSDYVYFITHHLNESGEDTYHFFTTFYLDTHGIECAEFQFC